MKRSPPYLAILTEPDACDSRNRIDETYHAIERAAYDGHVDLVVVRVADDLSPIEEDKRNIRGILYDEKRMRNMIIIHEEVKSRGRSETTNKKLIC